MKRSVQHIQRFPRGKSPGDLLKSTAFDFMKQPGKGKFDAAALRQFGEALLVASGLAEDRARDVAEVLLEGDLLGHTTHGFALLPDYLKALKDDTMEKRG